MYILGCAFLVYLSVTFISQAIIFLLGYPLTIISLWIGLVAAIIVIIISPKQKFFAIKTKIILMMTFISLLIITGIVAGYFFDVSWDGRDYHQKAISQLVNGWNPDYKTLEPENDYYNLMLNCYPKGPWILSALLYKFSGNIEIGKSTHLLLIISVFLISASLLIRLGIKKWKMVLLSLLLAFNPISMVQALTFYVDGILASLITLYILISCFSLLNFIPAWFEILSFGSVLALGLNVKFNGVAYFGIFILGFLILKILIQKTISPRFLLSHIIIVGLALVLVGFNPYILNTIKYKNPVYPTLGGEILNIPYNVERNIPSNFKTMFSLEKLAFSVFSPSQNTYGSDTGALKFPLFFNSKELKSFITADTRIGGWGPLFGGALLLSLIVGFYLLRSDSRIKFIFGFWIGLIMITVIINPESWWARFSPQFWLVPVMILGFYWLSDVHAGKIVSYTLMFILLINVFLVCGTNISANLKYTRHMRTQLNRIQQIDKKIYVYYGPLDATRITLDYYQIPYEVVNNTDYLVKPKVLSPAVFYSYERIP